MMVGSILTDLFTTPEARQGPHHWAAPFADHFTITNIWGVGYCMTPAEQEG